MRLLNTDKMLMLSALLLLCGCHEKPVSSVETVRTTQENPQLGEWQVLRLLNDRLPMNQYSGEDKICFLKANDNVYQWACDMFEGKDLGYHIFWQNNEHLNQSQGAPSAVSMPQNAEHPAIVSVKRRYGNTDGNYLFEHYWSRLVFELLNVRSFAGHQMKAANRDEYALEMCGIEYETVKNVGHFYNEIWLPWCRQVKFASNEKLWSLPTGEFTDMLPKIPPAHLERYKDQFDMKQARRQTEKNDR